MNIDIREIPPGSLLVGDQFKLHGVVFTVTSIYPRGDGGPWSAMATATRYADADFDQITLID